MLSDCLPRNLMIGWPGCL